MSESKRKKLEKAAKKYKKDIFGKVINKLIEKIRFEDEYEDIPIEIINDKQYLLFLWLLKQEDIAKEAAYGRLDKVKEDFLHPIKYKKRENCRSNVQHYIDEMALKEVMFISLSDAVLYASRAKSPIKKTETLRKLLFEYEDLNRTIKALLNDREVIYITLDGIAYSKLCQIQITLEDKDIYSAYKILHTRPIWELIRKLKYEELKLTQKDIKPYRLYSLTHPYTKPQESYKDIYPFIATRGRLILTKDHKQGAEND